MSHYRTIRLVISLLSTAGVKRLHFSIRAILAASHMRWTLCLCLSGGFVPRGKPQLRTRWKIVYFSLSLNTKHLLFALAYTKVPIMKITGDSKVIETPYGDDYQPIAINNSSFRYNYLIHEAINQFKP